MDIMFSSPGFISMLVMGIILLGTLVGRLVGQFIILQVENFMKSMRLQRSFNRKKSKFNLERKMKETRQDKMSLAKGTFWNVRSLFYTFW